MLQHIETAALPFQGNAMRGGRGSKMVKNVHLRTHSHVSRFFIEKAHCAAGRRGVSV